MSSKGAEKAGHDQIQEMDLCTSCKKSAINCLFLECGHMVVCHKCGHSVKQCPVCDQSVVQCMNMDELHAEQQDDLDLSKFRGLVPVPVPVKPNLIEKKKGIQKPANQIQSFSDIQSEDIIAKLSIKQLKSLLKNKGNSASFCEKHEMVEYAKKCWKEANKNEKNKETTETSLTDDSCRICQKFLIDCIFVECGHMVTCYSCGKEADQCPIGCSGRPQPMPFYQLTDEYDQMQSSDNEEGYMWAEGICQECNKQGIDHIFPDCGHVVVCRGCSERITKCPICQQIGQHTKA